MVKRGWMAITVAGLMLVGCARPGAGDGSTEVVTPAPTTEPAVLLPTAGLAACFDRDAVASPGAPESSRPWPTGSGPGDAFERNQRANDMFRERRELPAQLHAAARPCVDEVRAALDGLRVEGRYDAGSVEAVLRSAGLSSAYARKPGRLDLGSPSGVVFSASPGVGCLVGHHGPDGTEVEFGGPVADGGCLVAPD